MGCRASHASFLFLRTDGEKGAVQNPFLRYAQEAGWTYLSIGQAPARDTSPVLDSVLVRQLQCLNPGDSGTSNFTEQSS